MTSLRLIAVMCVCGVSWIANGAEPQTNQPSRERLREQLRQLTPEERQQKIRELREQGSPASPWREEAEKRREEWKNLPVEERRAKMQEWRAKRGGEVVTPENRDLHRQQIRTRLQTQLQELNAKKAQGTLTADEQKRLAHLEQVSKYFTNSAPPTK